MGNTSDFALIVIAHNHLAFSCKDANWDCYELAHQELGDGCFLADMEPEWQECNLENEPITISSPGLQIAPKYDFDHYWAVFKKTIESGEVSYMEVAVIQNEQEALKWDAWRDAGFPKNND